MKRILLVKTSSLGDVVHNLPVVSDIRRRFSDAAIDWVLEEAYVPLARLHPGVHRTIAVAIRRWRKRLLGAATWEEIGGLRRALRSGRYDAVIDTQGLIKSALIAAAASGRSHGFDAASAREPLAARFYDVVHHVARSRHAVERNRELAAAALGYRVEEPASYGIDRATAASGQNGAHVVFLHSSARPEKHWLEDAWFALGRLLEARGFRVVLPWGSEFERARSERIAATLAHARVPEALALGEVARLLAGAKAVVGLDTGLTHLAAALGVPVAAIYCGTDPQLYGVHGAARARNLGGPGRAPKPLDVLEALADSGAL